MIETTTARQVGGKEVGGWVGGVGWGGVGWGGVREEGWWWCGQDVMTMSLSIPSHERAPNWGHRTPGTQTPGVPATLCFNVPKDGGRKCSEVRQKPLLKP